MGAAVSDHDDLRVRLARLDPSAGTEGASSSPDLSPRAHEILERTMSTPVLTDTPDATRPAAHRRRTWVAAAAVAAVAAGGLGLALSDGGSAPAKKPTTLALSLPAGGAMSSCMQFSTDILKGMTPAFAGTVTSLAGSTVTLSVDRWYAGGPADEVTLTSPGSDGTLAMDGVAFEEGARYLVTAAGGTVNGCGYSGPATPELERAFATAFGG